MALGVGAMGHAARHGPPPQVTGRRASRLWPSGSGSHTARPGPAVDALYTAHYRALTQLATLLAGDVGTAEEIVQDAFVALHGTRQLREGADVWPCLLQAVVRRSRFGRPARARTAARPDSRPRAAGRDGGPAAGGPARLPDAGPAGLSTLAALQALPARQREALVLRYYADLPEGQIASAMGVSVRAVRGHLTRGMSALRNVDGVRP